jgi:hypothetical protein
MSCALAVAARDNMDAITASFLNFMVVVVLVGLEPSFFTRYGVIGIWFLRAARTQRYAGEGELVFELAKHERRLPERGRTRQWITFCLSRVIYSAR